MSTDITIDQPTVRQVDQERIRNAQKKRNAQLKAWAQYDRKMELEMGKRRNKGFNQNDAPSIHFPQDIVLMEAAFRGDLDELRRLLEEGICPDVVNADGLTVLHQSSIDNNIEMCKLLLNFGADINAKDQELWTPLHVAAACPHPELCKFLIDRGADLLALNADGNMPYDICEDDKALTIIENEMAAKNIQQSDIDEKRRVPERMMICEVEQAYKEGRDLDQLDPQGAAYIHIAASCGYADVVSNLMDHGANIDILDKDGWKAIHIAAYWSHLEVINVLCNYGADIDGKTTNGETVFSLCQDEELLQRLVELKRDIERMRMNNQVLNTSKATDKSKGLIRRRSSNNPRGSSIRRTSMREKKAMSWKEAREEGSIFSEKGLPMQPKELSGTNPNPLNSPEMNDIINSPLSPNTDSLDRLDTGRYNGSHGRPNGHDSDYATGTPRRPIKNPPNSFNGPPALPPGSHRNNYAISSPQIRTSLDGILPRSEGPPPPATSTPRNPPTSAYRDNRPNQALSPPLSRPNDPGYDDSPEFIYRPPNRTQPSGNGKRPSFGAAPGDSTRSPVPSQFNAYNSNSNGAFPPNQRTPSHQGLDFIPTRPINPSSGPPKGPRGPSSRIPYGYEDNLDEKRRIAQSGKCCLLM